MLDLRPGSQSVSSSSTGHRPAPPAFIFILTIACFVVACPGMNHAQTIDPRQAALPLAIQSTPSQVLANDSTPQSLSNSIQDVIESLSVETLPETGSRLERLTGAIAETQAYFARAADAENYLAWMDYLQLEPLIESLKESGTVAERGRAAVALRRRLVGPEIGLELSRLTHLRQSLDEYIAALKWSGDAERRLELLGRELGSTREAILADEDARSLAELEPDTIARLESLIRSLAEAGQATAILPHLVNQFSHPNARVWIDGNTITTAVNRSVSEPSPVNDCILGTRLRGQSRLTGTIRSQLLPTSGYVRLLVRLDGNVTSSTIGTNGPVKIDSTGRGEVYVARQFAITQRGVVLGDVVSTAHLATTINRIIHPLKIVRRIAAKQAAETKPATEAIARGRMQNRIADQFRQQTDQAGKQTFPDLDPFIEPWLQRLEIPAPVRTLRSTDREVFLTSRIQHPLGLAASGSPPSPTAMLSARPVIPGVPHRSAEVVLQIHESLLSNTIVNALSGQSFRPDDIDRLSELLGFHEVFERSPIPKAAADTEEPAKFEVDFAEFRPVFMEARDGAVRIGLRGTRFAQGDRELKRTMEVTATYRPVICMDGSVRLERDSQIDLSFPGGGRLTLAQTAIKANIIAGFDNLFPQQLLHRQVPIPASDWLPAITGRVVRVVGIDAAAGWLSVAVGIQ